MLSLLSVIKVFVIEDVRNFFKSNIGKVVCRLFACGITSIKFLKKKKKREEKKKKKIDEEERKGQI